MSKNHIKSTCQTIVKIYACLIRAYVNLRHVLVLDSSSDNLLTKKSRSSTCINRKEDLYLVVNKMALSAGLCDAAFSITITIY